MKTTNVHVTHLKDFYYDPNYTTPLNIAVKEFIVENVIAHKMNENNEMTWKIRCEMFGEKDDTWESTYNIAHVGKFHQYCMAHPSLKKFIPKEHKNNK